VCKERILRIAGERVDQLTDDHVEPRIQSATRGPDGRLWLGLIKGGVAQLGDHGELVVSYGPAEGMPEGAVNQILGVGEDTLWAGTEHGLARISDGVVKVFTTRDGLPSDHIRRLSGRDQNLWVGTAKGVALRREGHFDSIPSLPAQIVESILEDREHNVWI